MIKIETVADRPNARRVQVTADFPAGAEAESNPMAHRVSRQIVFELAGGKQPAADDSPPAEKASTRTETIQLDVRSGEPTMKTTQPEHAFGPRANSRSGGFTLVELLVVIAIIGVMVSMLLPAINGMRESARRSTCENKVVRLMMALEQYQSAHESLPSGVVNPDGPIRSEAVGMHHGWLEQVLPYIDEGNVFRNIDFNVSVYDEKNAPVRKLRIAEFICPSEVEVDRPMSSYAGCHHDVEAPIDADNHGTLFLNSHVSNRDIPDGAAHTLLAGEKIFTLGDLGWMSGTRATLRNTGHRIGSGPSRRLLAEGDAASADPDADPLFVGGFASYHPGGAVFGFADGSVEFLGDEIDQTVFEQLGNRADGALVDDTMLH